MRHIFPPVHCLQHPTWSDALANIILSYQSSYLTKLFFSYFSITKASADLYSELVPKVTLKFPLSFLWLIWQTIPNKVLYCDLDHMLHVSREGQIWGQVQKEGAQCVSCLFINVNNTALKGDTITLCGSKWVTIVCVSEWEMTRSDDRFGK